MPLPQRWIAQGLQSWQVALHYLDRLAQPLHHLKAQSQASGMTRQNLQHKLNSTECQHLLTPAVFRQICSEHTYKSDGSCVAHRQSSKMLAPLCPFHLTCMNSGPEQGAQRPDLVAWQAPLHTQQLLGKGGNAFLQGWHVQLAEGCFCPRLRSVCPSSAAGPNKQPQLNLRHRAKLLDRPKGH